MFLFVLCTIFKYNQTNIKRFELPRIHRGKDLTYPGFKFKSEEIERRRSKVLELKSQGLDQREMQVTPALISFDLQYPREGARKNVREYATKQASLLLLSLPFLLNVYV
jgi:hypothetical protein